MPLAGPALEVLQKLEKMKLGGEDDHVFWGTGSFEHSWLRVVKRAKLIDFRFHDLRHTAASYLAMRGRSPSEIAAVLGHKTLQMVKRYAHIHDEHVSTVVAGMVEANLGGVTYAGPVTKPAQAAEVVDIATRQRKASA